MTRLSLLALSLISTSLLALFGHAEAQNQPNWTVSPFNPPSIPVAVKTQVLNLWQAVGGDPYQVNNEWPRVSDNIHLIGWSAFARVDGTPYQLFGNTKATTSVSVNSAEQKSASFSPTKSTFVMYCGGMVSVYLTFFTPIEATDLTRLSIPFSYLQISVSSDDAQSHEVEIYSDVTGELITGDDSLGANWTINDSDTFVYLQMQLTDPTPFTEEGSRPQDATLYYAVNKTSGTTWQIGYQFELQQAFLNGSSTTLTNTSDPNFASVADPNFHVLAFAVDLGTVETLSDPVVFSLGVVREPDILFTNQDLQQEERSAFYWSAFSDIHDVIEDVLNHYDAALDAGNALDAQIANAASGFPSEYYGLLSLATRQAMGATEYTLIKDSSGMFNMSDIKAFLANIQSVGYGGVNSVDVLYAAMPIFLYLNPAILGYHLSPLLAYQMSSEYTNSYAARCLGTQYPKAPGDNSLHNERIEQSANMLVMALAHVQASGDNSLIAQFYPLLNEWGSFLVSNSMSPDFDTPSPTDGMTSINQTNIALKGIIGIGAMARIAETMGQSADATMYSEYASVFATQFLSDASSSTSFSVVFGSSNPGFLYNLYADKLLGLNLIDNSVYEAQTTYYGQVASRFEYGIPLDSANASSVARADWMLFGASIATDTDIRDAMIKQVYAYASGSFISSSSSVQNNPFAIAYSPSSGLQISGGASPAIGAMFALLLPNITSSNSGNTALTDGSSKSPTAAIVGSVVGGVAGIVLIGALAVWFWRWRRRPRFVEQKQQKEELVNEVHYNSVPFDGAMLSMAYTRHLPRGPRPSPMSLPDASENRTSVSASRGSMTDLDRKQEVLGTDAIQAQAWPRMNNTAGTASAVASSVRPIVGTARGALRMELDDLRREFERMRTERMAFGEVPPNYEEFSASVL